jgi:cysteine synthase
VCGRVFSAFIDPTPGPRHLHGFNDNFPWRGNMDACLEVASIESFRLPMQLSREGLIAGPSSGEALRGVLDYLAQLKGAGEFQQLADEATGEISCVFTCSDLPYPHLSAYFEKLGADEFPPIENKVRAP